MLDPQEYDALLRSDFVSFLERAFYELNPDTELRMASYIELMASRLEDCRHGRIRRLAINIPPRYLKSHCASIAFVAWVLGHQPSAKFICASYGQDLAEKLALDTRKVMQSAWYQRLFPTRLSPEKNAVSEFLTTEQGSRLATSVGGVLTGRGADFIILDDPLKPEDALSETRRTAVNNWYDSTLLSRLNDKVNGCIIVIMQRLHQDDLVGHILTQDPWNMLSFPAIAETDERHEIVSPLGRRYYTRSAGEPLHVERESLASLRATQSRIGDYNFSSQYQQNPIPEGGAIVKSKWLMVYQELPAESDILVRIQSWDTAVKTQEFNDYSVCTTWVMDRKRRFYLEHVLRQRMEFPELKKAVIEQRQRFRPSKVLIEDKSSGASLIQDLRRQGFLGVEAHQLPKGQDKAMRLHALTHLFEAGLVHLPEQAPWLPDYRTELLGFPGSKFDDQVDSTTQALDYLYNKGGSKLAIWTKLGQV